MFFFHRMQTEIWCIKNFYRRNDCNSFCSCWLFEELLWWFHFIQPKCCHPKRRCCQCSPPGLLADVRKLFWEGVFCRSEQLAVDFVIEDALFNDQAKASVFAMSSAASASKHYNRRLAESSFREVFDDSFRNEFFRVLYTKHPRDFNLNGIFQICHMPLGPLERAILKTVVHLDGLRKACAQIFFGAFQSACCILALSLLSSNSVFRKTCFRLRDRALRGVDRAGFSALFSISRTEPVHERQNPEWCFSGSLWDTSSHNRTEFWFWGGSVVTSQVRGGRTTVVAL